MKELKALLGEELYNQVIEKLGDTKLVVDDGSLIPKYRLDEVIQQRKALQDQVAKYEKDLTDLKKLASGNEELTKQISALQEQNKALTEKNNAELVKIQKSFALKEALLSAGVTDQDSRELLINRFDLEKLELDDSGKLKNADELIKPFKEHPVLKNLFGTPQVLRGANPHINNSNNPDLFTREQVQQMTPEEVEANYDAVMQSMLAWKQHEK